MRGPRTVPPCSLLRQGARRGQARLHPLVATWVEARRWAALRQVRGPDSRRAWDHWSAVEMRALSV